MILFETNDLQKLPEILKRFIQEGYEIYYRIEGPAEMYRLLLVEVKLDSNVVATADFVASDDEGHCQNIEVKKDYRRKGIGTAIYVFAEYSLECVMENYWADDPKQSVDAKKIWTQVDRPFGNKKLD